MSLHMNDLLTRHGYNWPSSLYKPLDHQRVTAEFMCCNPRSFCLNDIGTSKTLTLLWASDFLMRAGKLKKVLIASPLSTLDDVWECEIFMHIHHRSCAVLHGSKARRLKELNKDVNYYIINHHGVKVILKELAARKDIGLLIVDEGAEMRNSRTTTWQSMWDFAGPDSGRALWWVTGSPMPKGPLDIWAQARIVNPTLVPRYFTRFRDDLAYKQGFAWIPRQGWEAKCYSILQPSIRFTRDECFDLPPCTTQHRKVDMSKEQKRIYSDMLSTFVAEMKSGKITAVNEGAKRIKLLQIAAGAVYDGSQSVHYIDCKPKLDALKSTIHEAGNKAIVFVSFRHSIPLLEKFIKKMGLSVGVVYGAVSPSARHKVFSDFQRGDLQIILAHPQTMAHGLTLTASHTIIWWAPVDSFAIFEQAIGRITRSGQTRKQTIVQLYCSEIESRVYTKLRRKETMQGLLLSLLESSIKD